MKLTVRDQFREEPEVTVTAVVLPPLLLDSALRMKPGQCVVFLAIARVNAQGYLAGEYGALLFADLSARTVQSHLDTLVNAGHLTKELRRTSRYSKDLSVFYRVHAKYGIPYETLERRTHISVHLRRAIAERDGHACRYCGSTDRLNIEHVYPWSRGGKDTEENLVLACWACNNHKRARTPEEAGMQLRPLEGMN